MENKQVSHITMSFTGRYGHYYLDGIVNGQKIRIVTTNSEAYDWYNDDLNEEKHREALRYCNSQLIEAYERKFENGGGDE